MPQEHSVLGQGHSLTIVFHVEVKTIQAPEWQYLSKMLKTAYAGRKVRG